ncbi:T9SS type A sorting domain-containing protein [Winogradskyella luteola]|uniref:T9SS type A sorting domain-containing protein n=1 Tax=Winogradskyella luteola TaxID=2828330 RepID=A0A9X1FCB4_9FLAO|nr:T9SS type A sorting domain-containing protein [Winogradskyella luteola]MBV7270348.1 T9SS type A sorting domain-containing protein [Winogradskyella luteola]
MKYTPIACLMLCFSIASAQSDLFVSNGSYVYVDGTAFTSGPTTAPLFVTDDISLENNSHIYLRNEAQLIQGDLTAPTGNSGEGKLSIYQTGTVNQWSYNYWCSPVGNNSTLSGNETSRVNLLNDVDGLITSVPALFTGGLNGSASPLTISNRWLYTYETSSNYSDWVYVGESGAIDPGLGFTMKGNGTATTGSQVYDFRGKPNNGTITNPVSNGNFTLVGNPYPSAMDSAAFIHDSDNVNEIIGTLFYWEQDGTVASHNVTDYIGGYHEFTIDAFGTIISNAFAQFETYDGAGNTVGIPPGPPGGTKQARRYIPIGQGFMVEGRTGTTNVVTTKNSHRVFQKEGANSYFFRGANVANTNSNADVDYQDNGLPVVPAHCQRFRINIDFTVSEGQYTRQLLLNFLDSATFGDDRGLELHRSNNLATDAYFTQNDDIYSGLAYPFDEMLTIPLVIDVENQQPLRFRVFDIQNFDDAQDIYIHDIENELYVNLREQDYELNIDPGNYAERFEIVFVPGESLNIDDFEISKLTINQNNSLRQLSVLNPNGLNVKSIEVFDISGKRMLNSLYDGVSDRYKLSTVNLSDAVYIVKVISDSNIVKSEKIIVKN